MFKTPNAPLTLILALAALGVSDSACAEAIAKLRDVAGVVSLQSTAGKLRLGYEGAALEKGDVVVTEKDSSALLLFTDKSQVVLRPGTRLTVTQYQFNATQPEADSMVMKLLRGGLRTVTGLIGKRGNQDAYRLQGGTATIGIRGTDFTARLCEGDCLREQKQASRVADSNAGIIGRVGVLEGPLSATSAKGVERSLGISSPVFEGDRLEMGNRGYATVVMRDGSRVLINQGSRLVLSQFRYQPRQADQGNMLVDLLRGNFRIVTGLLAKARPDHVRFNTATATIGIRGTAFDVVCAGADAAASNAEAMPLGQDCNKAVFVAMREGRTELRNAAEGSTALPVEKGQAAWVEASASAPALLPTPRFIERSALPLPEKQPIDEGSLFGQNADASVPGLYVEVNEGRVVLRQEEKGVELARGESALAGTGAGAIPQRLPTVPLFLDHDPALGTFKLAPQQCGVN